MLPQYWVVGRPRTPSTRKTVTDCTSRDLACRSVLSVHQRTAPHDTLPVGSPPRHRVIERRRTSPRSGPVGSYGLWTRSGPSAQFWGCPRTACRQGVRRVLLGPSGRMHLEDDHRRSAPTTWNGSSGTSPPQRRRSPSQRPCERRRSPGSRSAHGRTGPHRHHGDRPEVASDTPAPGGQTIAEHRHRRSSRLGLRGPQAPARSRSRAQTAHAQHAGDAPDRPPHPCTSPPIHEHVRRRSHPVGVAEAPGRGQDPQGQGRRLRARRRDGRPVGFPPDGPRHHE